MFFSYPRGIKDLDIGYNEFQPKEIFQTVRQPQLDHSSLLPLEGSRHFWAAGAGQRAVRPGCSHLLGGLGLILDTQNHQVAVTVVLTGCCYLSTQQDWDSDLIYLSGVSLRWTHARTIFHFWQSRAPLLFSVLPAPLLAPSCLLVLLHPHPTPTTTLLAAGLRSTRMFLGVSPKSEKSYIGGFKTGGTDGSQYSNRSPSPVLSGSPAMLYSVPAGGNAAGTSEH